MPRGAGPPTSAAPSTAIALRPRAVVARIGGGGTGEISMVDPAATHEKKRTWQLVIGGLSAVVLLAVCGLGSYFMVADERQGLAARDSAAEPTTLARDISGRIVDPVPLTEAEVFPGRQIVIDSKEPAYQVLKTQAATDCTTAATGEINGLLAELGCNQVIRGTLRSPTGGYLVTAGLFNLADAAGASWAHEKIKPIVDGGKGRFQGLAAGKGTEAVALASAQAGWHVRGHFLVYCVIAKTDGTAIGDNDPYAQQILYDMIELHLRGGVLERWATVPVDPSAGATPVG
jgi:hypothetical protein